jgi:hypothetical protein
MYLIVAIKSSPHSAVVGTMRNAKIIIAVMPEPKKWRYIVNVYAVVS